MSNRLGLVMVAIGLIFFLFLELYLEKVSIAIPSPKKASRKSYMTMACLDSRGLGNMMFNYASLVGIAGRYNATPVMPDAFGLFHVFNLSIMKIDNLDKIMTIHTLYSEKHPCKYDNNTENLMPWTNYKLAGYFQSFRYFEAHSDIIRQDFMFKPSIIEEAESFLDGKIGTDRTKAVLVGIHVRRGDILLPHFVQYGYVTPGEEYYKMTREYFQTRLKNVYFIVCSNDKEWAQQNIKGNNVIHSLEYGAAVDMAILSLCDHMILSLGTFGWWSAWLSNGTTVYYNGWPKPLSPLDKEFDKKVFFPSGWIPMQ